MPMINITLFEGYSKEKKREIAEELTKAVVKAAGVKPETVQVYIDEYSRDNVSRAGVLFSDMQ